MTATPLKRHLGSVAIPCLSSDLPALRRIFELWSDPRFFPLMSAQTPKPALLIVFNLADAAMIAETHALYTEFAQLQTCFETFEVFSAGLEGDRDLYVRGSLQPEGAFGNKAGPNFLFQQTMHIAADFGLYTFQVELDCLPLRANWLHELNQMLTASEAWVIGAPYLGEAPLDPSIQFHINGNALYRCGAPQFLTFLDSVWIKSILALTKVYPNLAYDCWWALQMARSNAAAENASWQVWQEYCFFFQYSAFVINLTVADDECTQYIDIYDSLVAKDLRPLFLHGSAINRAITLLCENKDMSVLQALEALEESSVRTRREKTVENTSPTYAFVGAISEKYDIPKPPRLLVGAGFYAPEGPSDQYFPTRYVWTNSSRLEISLTDTRHDLRLFFRDGRGRSFHSIGAPEVRIFKQQDALPCTCEVLDDPTFACLHLHREDIPSLGVIEIETGLDTFMETNSSGRELGILVFEIGFRLGRMRSSVV